MRIKARFPSRCPACLEQIEVGSEIEWERGEKARHPDCVGKPDAPKPQASAPRAEVGDFHGVYALFEKAAKHIKRPKVRLAVPFDGDYAHVTLYRGGERSRFPGQINVAAAEYGAGWYGRIDEGGEWFLPKNTPAFLGELRQLLIALAENPDEVAAEYGKLMGHCCFCARRLTDDGDGRSVEVGYGPVCAKRYGLPWGTKS